MRSRRSISDIVAVVLLIVIAIAAAVIIYMWLSGLIGGIHTSTSATQVKLEITGAKVTYNSAASGYNVTAYLYNPPGSPSTSITLGELEFTNGTVICTNSSSSSPHPLVVTPSPIAPGSTATVIFICKNASAVPAGMPVEIVLFTSEGVQVTYTATVS